MQKTALMLGLAFLSLTQFAASMAKADNKPTIAVIGTGDLGSAMGLSFAKAGYSITFGSRTPNSESVKGLVQSAGPKAGATEQMEAAQKSDIVVLAVPWPAMEQVAQNLGDLTDKVVIDVSWPMQQAADGYMESMVETSSAEMIQDWNPGAKVVKIGAPGSYLFTEPATLSDRTTVFIAGNDNEAKQATAEVLFATGLEPLDAGPLRHAREIEGMGLLYMVPLLQRRKDGWEYSASRSSYWPCVWDISESYAVVKDAETLTNFPRDKSAIQTCP